MHQLNVTFGETKDEKRLKRFFPVDPVDAFEKKLSGWGTWDDNGSSCCSDRPISFHYVTPSMMHAIYYFVYQLK